MDLEVLNLDPAKWNERTILGTISQCQEWTNSMKAYAAAQAGICTCDRSQVL